jgi:uracil-DNA glycosylase family 4
MAALQRAGFANRSTSTRVDDGLALRDVFITAAVRCAPPDNKPTPDEIVACLTHLDGETAALPDLEVVVALGAIGFEACLRLLAHRGQLVRPRPAFSHGTVVALPNGWHLVGSYHPSRQNTQTGRLTPAMLDDVFRKARALLDHA